MLSVESLYNSVLSPAGRGEEGVTKTLCRYKIRVKPKLQSSGFLLLQNIKLYFNPVGDTDKSIKLFLKEFPDSPVADDRYCLADSFVTIKVLHFLSSSAPDITDPQYQVLLLHPQQTQDVNRNIFRPEEEESSGFNYNQLQFLSSKNATTRNTFSHKDCMLISLI